MLCRVLRSERELADAQREYRSRGLCAPTDRRKAWDNLVALEALAHTSPHESIADLGCRSGILLTWLHQMGRRNLWGCDLKRPLPAFKRAVAHAYFPTFLHGLEMYARNRPRMTRSPAENTGFPGGAFAAVTAMSLIEHRVRTADFFAEACRLLRPGGIVFLSTDYWSSPMSTPSGDRVFGPDDVVRLSAEAANAGLVPLEEPALEVGAPVILEGGLRYTFLTLAFERPPPTRWSGDFARAT